MNEISCDICMDLMPLVRDGVASEESRMAVERHIQGCEACRAYYESETIQGTDREAVLSRAMKKVRMVSTFCLGAIVLLCICLCEMVFQGSSVFFLGIAAVIRWLMRFAFGKKEGERLLFRRIAAFLTATALVAGLLWGANEVFGNPVSKSNAEKAVQLYLEEKFPELDLRIEDVSYAMSSTTYEAEVWEISEIRFRVVYRDGEILYDTYDEDVLGIFE